MNFRPLHLLCALLLADAAAAAELDVVMRGEGDCFRFESFAAWAKVMPAPARSLTREKFDHFRATIRCSFFSYEVDGVAVSGFSAMPKDTQERRLPAIIYNRGGNGELGRVTFARMAEDIFPLASRGFFVIGSQYRDADEFGGKDVDDVLALLTIIDRRADVAADRIGMMGFSRGGVTTMLAASRTTRLKALVMMASPADLHAELGVRPDMEKVFERRIPGYAANKEALLRARSPLFVLDDVPAAVPILLLHGGADERARPQNALQLAARLQELKRTYKLVVYPDGDHALSGFGPEVNAEIARWFEARL
jgi:dipeptidyl aminopeptidase/acylaminoacyl peptidase